MKIILIFSLFATAVLLLCDKAACTHLETCECHEIKAIVNATVEKAMARLEYKLNDQIMIALGNINKTDNTTISYIENGLNSTMNKLLDVESNLKSTMVKLIGPIQRQLDYHLPPPPMISANNSEENPAGSCKDVYNNDPDAQSGYYWITTSGSQPVRVYCNLSSTCGMTGGWMRVAHLDMRNSSHQCPSGLTLLSRSSSPKRLCDVTRNTCISNHYRVHGKQYSHIYGKIIAYQNQRTAAFYYNSRSIDQNYIFGVSLTHGQNPRKHIWTFAGALDESTSSSIYKQCPCIHTSSQLSVRVPSFVGYDYFCDTGTSYYYSGPSGVQPNDPLWDGQGCGSSNTCCSVTNDCSDSPPWFIKHLPSLTTDDVEMRVCRPDSDGTTPIEIVELYVQ